ncbi:MAG: hypothetical protein ACREHF_13265 [Rhizomicrobium sp.]
MSDHTELFFSPDFAARVLGEADRIAARGLRRRRLAGVAATAASLALLLWVFVPATGPDTHPAAGIPRFVDNGVQVSAAPNGEPDALGYLFPDAEPVARFAAQYADANDSAGELDLLADADEGTQ